MLSLTVSHWGLEATDGALKPECAPALSVTGLQTQTYVAHDRTAVEAAALEIKTRVTAWRRCTQLNNPPSTTGIPASVSRLLSLLKHVRFLLGSGPQP